MWLALRIIMISPAVSSVTASIEVEPGRRTFRVRCTSSGGRALSMSVTGPGFSGSLDNIQADGPTERIGDDRFFATTNIISGGSDGQSYQCTASNEVSTDPTGSVQLRGDLFLHNRMVYILLAVFWLVGLL